MKPTFFRLLLFGAFLSSGHTAFAMAKALGITNVDEIHCISPELVATKLHQIMAARMHEKETKETAPLAKPDIKEIARESIYCIESNRLYNNYFSSYFNIDAFEEQMDKYHTVLSPRDVHEVHANIEQNILRQKHMSDFLKQQELMFIKREILREYYKRNLEKPGSISSEAVDALRKTINDLVNQLFVNDTSTRETVSHHILHRLNMCPDEKHEKLNAPLTRIPKTYINTQK
jgi:hypothetical protein